MIDTRALAEIISPVWHEIDILPIFAIYFAIEYIFPARKVNWRDVIFNWAYWPIWIVGIIVVMQVKGSVFYTHVTSAIDRFHLTADLRALHPVLGYLAVLFLFDVFYYWFHRAQHTRVLWEQHKFHHSDESLNSSTAFRHHWLENFVRIPLVDIPMLFFYLQVTGDDRLHWYEKGALIFITYLGIFAHSNLRVSLGPLNFLIVTPQTHRIHHSAERRHWGKNFAAYFPIIDVIFGTYFAPARDEYPATGLGPKAPDREVFSLSSFWRSQTYPIVRIYRKLF